MKIIKEIRSILHNGKKIGEISIYLEGSGNPEDNHRIVGIGTSTGSGFGDIFASGMPNPPIFDIEDRNGAWSF